MSMIAISVIEVRRWLSWVQDFGEQFDDAVKFL